MPSNRQDFVGPILLAIFAYLASMLTRAFQRSLEQNVPADPLSELVIQGQGKNKQTKGHLVEHVIIDDFMTDQSKLNILQDSKLWDDCVASGSKWWDGKSKPRDIWEELNQNIWNQRLEGKDAIGFEYWCDVFMDNGPGAWHIDKDEVVFEQSDKLITPIMGAMYYGFNHTSSSSSDNNIIIGGGHLHLINADFRDNPLEFDVVRKDEIVEISPDFNRVVIFNSSKWHKVTRVTGGKRYAFVSNANSHVPGVFAKKQG